MATQAVEDTKHCVQAVLDRIEAVLDDEEVQEAEKLDVIADILKDCNETVDTE